MKTLTHKKWAAALDECDSHILRIQHALNHLADKLPISKEGYDFLNDRDIAYIDQLVFRFSKLQRCDGQESVSAELSPSWRGCGEFFVY